MAVTSIRLNENEEKVLNYLKDHYHCDASTLLKKSLFELYEDMKDKEIIEDFENKLKKSKSKFITADDILK
jgi:predicted DNA-binding protein